MQGHLGPVCMVSTVFDKPGMDLIPVFARTQSKAEDNLEGQVFQGSLFKGFNGNLKSAGRVPGKGSRRGFLCGSCLPDK